MRLVCGSVEDFLFNVLKDGAQNVDRRVIYVDYQKTPFGESKSHDCVKWQILLQSFAIVNAEDGGQFLLQTSVDCGVDYTDASNELNGSKKALDLKKQIEYFCEKNDLTIRPGIVNLD